MAVEKTIILKGDSKDAVKSVEKVSKTLKEAKEAQSDFKKEALDGIKSFKVMGVSVGQVSKAFKLLRVSIIATGIGAIVIAVVALASAFLSTQEGVDKLNSVLTPLKTVLDAIWGIAQKLGKGLFQMVSGDVQKGWKTMGDAVENVGEQMEEAWKRGKKLHDLQIQIRNDGINNIKAIALLNKHIQEQKFISEDITKSYKDRKAALENVLHTEGKLVDLREEAIKKRIELIKEEQIESGTLAAGDLERVQLEADLINIQSERFTKSIEATVKLNALNEQFKNNNKEREESKEIETKTKPVDKKLPLSGLTEDELLVSIDTEANLLEAASKSEERRAKELAAKLKIIEKKKKDDRDAAIYGSLAVAGDVANALSSLAAEGSEEAKNYAIGAATIQALMGAISAYNSALAVPVVGIVLAPIAAAVALAIGYANVKKIKSQDTKGGGGSGGSFGGGGRAAIPSTAAPSFNVVGTSSTNQLAQSINTQPIKTYVVASDVSTQQSLDRNKVENATFG
jgi:hypothetical protein